MDQPLYPNTPEGEIRMVGLVAQGLRHPSRRRRKALKFAAWWALATVVIVVAAVVAFG